MEKVAVKKLRPGAVMPKFGSKEAAGADLYACLEESVIIAPGQTVFIPTGLAMALPRGYVGLVYARSGLACKQDLAPANKVGVIDSDYRGEFMIALHNHGAESRRIANGDRIAQLVVTPVIQPVYFETDTLDETDRGTGGFGSTGEIKGGTPDFGASLLCINAVLDWFRWSPRFRPWFSGPRRPGAACPGGRCHCL